MAAATTALILGGLAAGSQVVGGINQAKAQREQGDFNADQSRFNGAIADLQATDAVDRGNESASNLKRQAKGLQGSQKAAAAAQGIDASSGSAAELQNDTEKLSTLDALTIRNNAAREAFGYKAQALGFRTQADFDQKAARSSASNTILTSGANALSTAGGAYGTWSNRGKK